MTNALNIPGWKNQMELNYIIEIIKKCKPHSTIVEIGAAAGRLTWVLSENAPYKSNIYAIDLWNGVKLFTGKGYLLNQKQKNTLEYFLQFLQSRIHLNVTPIQGDSLIIEWNKKIDLIIIDPDDGFGKTNLYKHLEKWYPYVKKNGIISGYNFRQDRLDVCKQITSFSKDYNLNLEVDNIIGGWKFKKETT